MVRFRAASDQAVLVYLGEDIALPAHERVLKLLRQLQKDWPKWLRNVQPAYTSLMVTFDATRVGHADVESVLKRYEKRGGVAGKPASGRIEIPVCYGGEFGPDLEDVARFHGKSPEEVTKLHCAQTYHAYFLGFAPGFAYLGDLPAALATPRLERPRKKVPAGSVGIAGKQTAIYPCATPGGWRLIGRTPIAVFKSDRKPMNVISIGDRVKFRAISREEFLQMETG
jgi:inhibitor of KinA